MDGRLVQEVSGGTTQAMSRRAHMPTPSKYLACNAGGRHKWTHGFAHDICKKCGVRNGDITILRNRKFQEALRK